MRKSSILSEFKSATEDQRPVVELTQQQMARLKSVAGVALAVVVAAGIITVSALAPNLFVAVDQARRMAKRKKLSFKEKQAKTAGAFYYLKRHGLIQIKPEQKGLMVRLTSKGKLRAKKLTIDVLGVSRVKHWDGKWWLVAADIPTKKYRWAADLFRMKIKQMRFYPLQRTMWFYPYNPASEIEFLANHFGIGQFVTVMEVSRMDSDDEFKLKSFFKL